QGGVEAVRPDSGERLEPVTAGTHVSRLRRFLSNPWSRSGIVLAFLAGVGALLWWHGPHWGDFKDAFTKVQWEWVAAAVGFNLLSIVARSFAWDAVIRSAMPPPH